MKSFLSLTLLFLSLSTFATGSLYCSTPAKEYEFDGTTGRVPGNPLVGGILVNTDEQTVVYPKSQIVGYWAMGDTVSFAIIDANAEKLLYSVETKMVYNDEGPSSVGVLTLASGEYFLITCEF